MKRMDSKGFSLLELVVVISMMAVLMAVLAPVLINYIDSSRTQKDESTLDEILNSTHIALSVDRVYNDAKSADIYVYIKNNAQISSNSDPLEEELIKLVPEVIVFESKKYNGRGGETIKITFSDPHGTFILEPSWVETTKK